MRSVGGDRGVACALERTAVEKRRASCEEDAVAYAPKLAFIHALVVALKWPHNELVLDMAMGAQPLGRVPDSGVWRHAPPAVPCDSFEQLMQEDPDWNTRLYNSIKAEGTKPENTDTALAAWARTMEEVDAG